MSLLTEVNGWVPVISSLAQRNGIITAAVYGAVWRYCQMNDRVCHATLETIGADLGIDKATVLRHIKKLCRAGYLRDLTPTLRNVPHTYADTGQVKLIGTIEAQTVAACNSLDKTVAACNATVAACNATVAESQLNRDSIIDSYKSVSHAPKKFLEKILKQHRAMALKLVEICGYKGPEFVLGKKLDELTEAVESLAGWNVTTEQLDSFVRWWWGSSPPIFRQVVEEWGKFLNAQQAQNMLPKNGHAPPRLTPEQIEAARQLTAETDRAMAESQVRVAQILNGSHANGIDVQTELKKLAKSKRRN